VREQLAAFEVYDPVFRDAASGVQGRLAEQILRKGQISRERYLTYRITSQYAHTTHWATGLYRKNLGVAAEYGDFTNRGMWHLPLDLAWFALEAPTARLLTCLGADAAGFRRSLPREAMARIIGQLGA
jgi:hypothetical protein